MSASRPTGLRRTLSVLTAGALALAVTPAVTAGAQTADGPRSTDLACADDPTATFPDIGGSVHEDNIRCLADLMVVQGRTDGTYGPRGTVQRDAMASFVVRAVEQYLGEELPGGGDDTFPDVPAGNVHRESINKLRAAGYIQGRTDGTYGPRDDVRRGQMARFIDGSLSFLDDRDGTNGSAPPPRMGPLNFADTLGSPFLDDIERLAAQGIVTGFEDGTYRPNDAVRRDQMASFIARMLDFAIEAELGVEDDAPIVDPEFPDFNETSRFVIEADPDQVPAGGQPGAEGTFVLRLDSDNDVVCYDIELRGVSGDYASPALTATHIHAGERGVVGPPVVVFDDPQPVDGEPDVRRSSGCVDSTAPSFPAGMAPGDADPGEGFRVATLENDPEAYYVDNHTVDFPAGSVRGQFAFTPTSTFTVEADTAQVTVDGGGEAGASGVFDLELDSTTNVVCYDITLEGVSGDYLSPARTATHIHAAVAGEAGPPVVAFADPLPVDASDPDGIRTSQGCVGAGANAFDDGREADPGRGFQLTTLEAQAEAYYVDNHTVAFPGGTVRGQFPFTATSQFDIPATADQVVGGGQPGATGTFALRLDADRDVICYAIDLDGVTGAYASPALTATHIHAAVAGVAGPAVVAFDDPRPVDAFAPDGPRTSSGCVDATAPSFPDGAAPDGVDPGDGFTVARIESDPEAYYVDSHTEDFLAGAVRGQFGFTADASVTVATVPGQVVGGGEEGATGSFVLQMDTTTNIVCFDIEVDGVSGEYSSPARTATHIHAGDAGVAGPPVVAFPDPVAVDAADPDGPRVSEGCLGAGARAFPVGSRIPGEDPGEGFQLSTLVADPAAYYVDVHTVDFLPGAVRGQFPDTLAVTPASASPEAADFTVPLPASSVVATGSSAGSVGQVTEAPEGYTVSEFGCHFVPIDS